MGSPIHRTAPSKLQFKASGYDRIDLTGLITASTFNDVTARFRLVFSLPSGERGTLDMMIGTKLTSVPMTHYSACRCAANWIPVPRYPKWGAHNSTQGSQVTVSTDWPLGKNPQNARGVLRKRGYCGNSQCEETAHEKPQTSSRKNPIHCDRNHTALGTPITILWATDLIAGMAWPEPPKYRVEQKAGWNRTNPVA